MKTLILLAALLFWLGCTAEVSALTFSALRINETAPLPGLFLLFGWLGLVGYCGWKSIGWRSHA